MKYLILLSIALLSGYTNACDCSHRRYQPVCGFDGRTYWNNCERRCADVEEAYEGVCRDCNCEDVVLHVCGQNGKTYLNSCYATCDSTPVKSLGKCNEECSCDNIANEVCGADKKTYRNACKAKCAGVEILGLGACPHPNRCFCTYHAHPSCGVDGKLYINPCHMRCKGVSADTYKGCAGKGEDDGPSNL